MDTKSLKRFFKKPKNIVWVTVFVVFMSLTTLVSFVYAKDTPKFIPEETRENIREGVVEAVAEPIGRVLPNMKEVIVRAAWTKEKKENYGNSYGHEEEGNGKKDTKNWPTYTDEETGISFKYPEGWVIRESSSGTSFFDSVYQDHESEAPMVYYRSFTTTKSPIEWINDNKYLFIGDQSDEDVDGFLIRESFSVNSCDGVRFTYESMGDIVSTVLGCNDKILVIEALTLGNSIDSDLVLDYEKIINSIK